jgi:hypothetical protein
VAERSETGEIVKRALAYPYASPRRSFLLEGAQATELVPEEILPDGSVSQTTVALPTSLQPLLAYGANASPQALARKLAALPEAPLFAARAWLDDFEVVYSRHVSPYGAVPATLLPSLGTSVELHVLYPNAEQLPLLVATEPNYELTRLSAISLRVELGPHETLTAVDAFLSRHGHLTVGGAPLALRGIPAHNRRLASLEEPDVLELVRSQLAPDGTLAHFITACVELGGVAPLPAL